jgi:hypothetical protein
MKTLCILFTIIAVAALPFLSAHAGEPANQTSGQDSARRHAAVARRAGPAQDGKERSEGKSLKLVGNLQAHPLNVPANHAPAIATAAHPASSKKAAPASIGGLALSKTPINREPSCKPPVGRGAIVPMPGTVHARGPAASSLNGAAASGARHSAAALNGASLSRNP